MALSSDVVDMRRLVIERINHKAEAVSQMDDNHRSLDVMFAG